MIIDYFAAANTARGFVNKFDQLTCDKNARIYLIKGGPGTGKSTFMKLLAARADAEGEDVRKIHCSSDYESLDGVFLPDRGIVVLDATAPHCVDPRYPAVVESILPFGEYWHREKLLPAKEQIIALTDKISGTFQIIYRYLEAIGGLRAVQKRCLSDAFRQKAAREQIEKLLRKTALLPGTEEIKNEYRFAGALTGAGPITFENALACKHTVVIDDTVFGAALYMNVLSELLDEMHQSRIVYLNSLYPDEIDHIVLPRHDLAFITKSALFPVQTPATLKTVALKPLFDKTILAADKNKLAFCKKTIAAITEEIQKLMASEKALHDELEQFYIQAMDFEALGQYTDQKLNEILADS